MEMVQEISKPRRGRPPGSKNKPKDENGTTIVTVKPAKPATVNIRVDLDTAQFIRFIADKTNRTDADVLRAVLGEQMKTVFNAIVG